MTPLLHHLRDRKTAGVASRMRMLEMAAPLPVGFRQWLGRRLWSGPLRHHRSIADGVSFDEDGAVKLRGRGIARAVALDALVGRITRPACIVATGPSARDHDFAALSRNGRMVVAVNGAPAFLKERGITPDLWVITDPDFAAHGSASFHHAENVPLVVSGPAAAILAKVQPSALMERSFTVIERVNAWYGIRALPFTELQNMNAASGSPFVFPDDASIAAKVGWSHAPELGFFSGCNVVFAALQVVAGLGAKDIEIIGMDLSGQGRVYDEGPSPRPSRLQEQYAKYILPSFEVMHRALEGLDVKVRNLSPVCPLPHHLFAPPSVHE